MSTNYTTTERIKEIINGLQEAAYWIETVAGEYESKQPHIQDMLKAINNACTILSQLPPR